MNEQKTIESNSPESKKEGLLQLHKGILDSMRKREGDTFKFITTLIGGSILPVIPYFFKDEIMIRYFWIHLPSCFYERVVLQESETWGETDHPPP